MSTPVIEVADVSKTFLVPRERHTRLKEHVVRGWRNGAADRNEALRGVSLTVEEGECLGVIGPNGSGKSTLLKVLAGIYRPDSGSVHVAGSISPFIELGVGFNPELSARDNVLVNGTLLGLTRDEIEERYAEILAFAEIERFAAVPLKNFSSGMMMRLGYAIAVQVPFEILLLDEVLAVGDVRFRAKCEDTFRRLRAEGKTVVLVSHDLGGILESCDRVLLLDRGECVAVGEAADVVALYEARQRNGRLPHGAVPRP